MPDNKKQKHNLTVGQRAFVRYYAGNATEAAKKAGYVSPEKAGTKLMAVPKVAEMIYEREEEEQRPYIATRKRRQEFWTATMEDPEEKMPNRLKASENLAKSEADFVERREHSGPDGGPMNASIQIEFVKPDE